MKRVLILLGMFITLNALLMPISSFAEGKDNNDVRSAVTEHSQNTEIPSGGIDIEGIKSQASSVDNSNLLGKVQDLSIYLYAIIALVGLLCLLVGKVKLCVSFILLGAVAVMGIHNVETIIATIISVGQWFFDFLGE